MLFEWVVSATVVQPAQLAKSTIAQKIERYRVPIEVTRGMPNILVIVEIFNSDELFINKFEQIKI